MHPDRNYHYNASESSGCHRSKPSKSRHRAGYWGTPVSECDTPWSLLNATFAWLEHWKHEVDFVVWTGDNARHDIDSQLPRSLPEIIASNHLLADRMRGIFGHIPIVPSLGNNDIFPHNIMFSGPSRVTEGIAAAWHKFVPEGDFHVFQRGAYFSREVIPGRLVVASLNTLYFYDSNKAVDGCPISKHGVVDPGTLELDWLEAQLGIWRARGLQVYLSGHVPPSPGNWYELCYHRYAELAISFQDIIVGQLYGHMNVDHWFWFDSSEILTLDERLAVQNATIHRQSDHEIGVRSIDEDLLSDYKDLPKYRKLDLDDYSIVTVSPSIIPTYLPALRIFTYNVSHPDDRYKPGSLGLSGSFDNATSGAEPAYAIAPNASTTAASWWSWELGDVLPFSRKGSKRKGGNKRNHRHRHNKKKRKRRRPTIPRHASPDAPSRTSRFLTPLSHTTWYIDLDEANQQEGYGPGNNGSHGNRQPPSWQIEYTTLSRQALARHLLGKTSKSDGPLALPATIAHTVLDRIGFSLSPSINDDTVRALSRKIKAQMVPYGLPDLTIGRWLKLARRMAKSKNWPDQVHRMFVSSGAEDD
ncbi:uncharacterized protein L969DRAFT_51759 [Mixia osmundae IAM 14324]|nr:uncharacterized protein L969DRAFT_51759 [Mixia osmundae IAM 14324]KEI37912.1 hypothetical protein L969DRAFT_51759 [Mixia osmundae IAM 14324]